MNGLMAEKPIHSDIETFDYILSYSPSENKWYTAYDTEKGSAWYVWDNINKSFELLLGYHYLPEDLIWHKEGNDI